RERQDASHRIAALSARSRPFFRNAIKLAALNPSGDRRLTQTYRAQRARHLGEAEFVGQFHRSIPHALYYTNCVLLSQEKKAGRAWSVLEGFGLADIWPMEKPARDASRNYMILR